MSDLQIPEEAIKAQQEYDAADAEVRRLAALLPPSLAIVNGEASITDEQRAELQTARGRRLDMLHKLRAARESWAGAGDPLKAELALRKAARSADDEPPGAA